MDQRRRRVYFEGVRNAEEEALQRLGSMEPGLERPMGHERAGATSPQGQASVRDSAATGAMPNLVVHDEDRTAEDVVQEP